MMGVNLSVTPLDAWVRKEIGGNGPLTTAVIDAEQLKRLNATLALAARYSPFYRKRLAGYDIVLRRMEDLVHLPFTDAEDLKREALRFPCVSQEEISRVVTLGTSGTTGAAKRLFFTREDQERTMEFFQWGMKALTDPGDRVLILFPVNTPGGVGDLLAAAVRRLGATPVLHGPLTQRCQAAELLKEEPFSVIAGPPVPVLALAYDWQQRGWGGQMPKRALLSADYVPHSVVKHLREIWNCEVFGHYGMTEMGLGGGVECAAHDGYHLREADLYFEVIDPVSGVRKSAGEEGEVVFTTLTRQGMPLIRYRTGDISRLLPGRCACGSRLRRLGTVTSRRDGVRCPGRERQLALADLDEMLFKIHGVVDYTAVLRENGDKRQLLLQVLALSGETMRCELEPVLAELLSPDVIDWRLDLMPWRNNLLFNGAKRVLERKRVDAH
ncbi:MAG TPA: AMP-binding protein [Patescibacteria group bacterium]|nr:AMP-binding protein [Patescibacteria group bacterium]